MQACILSAILRSIILKFYLKHTVLIKVNIYLNAPSMHKIQYHRLQVGMPIYGAKYALFGDVVTRNAPILSGIFYVFLRTLQYETKVSKLINWRC